MCTIRERTIYNIVDWANWVERRIMSSAIGYPSSTMEARLREYGAVSGGVPASISPECIMPDHVATVDRIVRDMPGKFKAAIYCKYFNADQPKDYRRSLDFAHLWVEAQMRAIMSNNRGCH